MKKALLISRRRSFHRPAETRSKESNPAYRVVATSIIVAIASAIIGYTVSFIDGHRKAQIQKVDTQIEKLYGPLYAYAVASRRAWDDLHGEYRPEKPYYFDDEDMPSAQLVEVWRRWMKAVFMPMNVKMESAIIDNAQLLDGNKIYPCFLDLISHVESYKATIASWKDTDDLAQSKYRTTKANAALIAFPPGFKPCVEMRLQAALKRRNELERSWLGLFTTASDLQFAGSCS
jgi:hypothetical protein